jgi:hypothetical protein
VKELLGHKHIGNTLIYVQLEKTILQSQNNEWIVNVAKSVEEVCQLVEVGFEYVAGEYTDGGKIFRKHK